MPLTRNELDALRAEYLDLFSRAATLIERCDEIKATVRANLPEGSYADGGVRVTPNRRFSADKAREVLPAELLALVEVEVPAHTEVDKTRARNMLAPTLYKACLAEVGDARVTIS